MFRKKRLILLLLCMVFLAACTQGNTGKSSRTAGTKIESLKNTYWVAEVDEEEWIRTVELIFNDDGSFHCRSIIPVSGYEPFCTHMDADTCTWIQNSDMVELEFNKDKPHKKEVFYARILNNGDKMECYDMFERSEDSLTFIKQESAPKLTSIEEDGGKVVGEWELVSVGGNSPQKIITDNDNHFESNLNIYMKNEKMYADYHILRWKNFGKNDIEQMGISLENKPINPGSLNEFWSACFDESISPEGVTPKEKLNVKFTLVDDNKIVLIEENPENEYDSPTELVYLRKGSKEYEDRENYFYSNTVTVSDINELIENLKNNTKIILKEGTYNFSDVYKDDSPEYDSIETYEDRSVMYLSHIMLEAEEGAEVNLLTNSATSNVLEFNYGNDISLKGLTIGHNVEKGDCTGNVLYFDSCDGVEIKDCKLFGCGTYGINAYSSSDFIVENTEIYECTYGLIELSTTNNVVFKNSIFRDSEAFAQLVMNGCDNILFENCQITNNKSEYFDNLFIDSTSSSNIVFKSCAFKDNTYKTRNNEEVEFTDCTFDDHDGE